MNEFEQCIDEWAERCREAQAECRRIEVLNATLQATLAEREAELESALAEQQVLDSKYVDERAAKSTAQDEADQYYKCLQIEKGEHATALAERDTARQDAARLREALYAIACKNEPFEREDMIDFAQRALKGDAPLTASRPGCATAEQVEQYIRMADAELGPECVDAWVEDIRQFLRTRYNTR